MCKGRCFLPVIESAPLLVRRERTAAMGKRKAVSSRPVSHESLQNSREDESDRDAQQALLLMNAHQDQQTRRRSIAGGRGSSSNTSIWSTLAATIVQHAQKPTFHCSVCSKENKLNKTVSNSNILLQYKSMHPELYENLLALEASGATEQQIRNAVSFARTEWLRKNKNSKITLFFCARDCSSASRFASPFHQATVNPAVDFSIPSTPVKVTQCVASVMYACVTETPLSRVGSPLLQGLVSVFGGRMQFSSKTPLDSYLLSVFEAVCNILKSSISRAMTGCISFDGWSSTIHAPILGVTWHIVDENWRLRCIPVATLNTADSSKNGRQMCAIIEKVMKNNLIVGSEKIRVHTATTDNEPATALAVDLFTNYDGSVRCVAHTLALAVNDVFKPSSPWQKYMDTVNSVTSFFNQNQKADMLLRKNQADRGITQDRMQTLKHDIPTRWHSRLGAMVTYLSRYNDIVAVADELNIANSRIPRLSLDAKKYAR